MKPSSNHIYCPAARKAKMLFESESKAWNFIRFNTREFEAKGAVAPLRAYYCILCIGWHVTSVPINDARLMDLHDRLLLRWLLAISRVLRLISLIQDLAHCQPYSI